MSVNVINPWEANKKTYRLRSPGALIHLSCSNMFEMSPEERAFVLDIVDRLETYSDSCTKVSKAEYP